MLHPKHELYFRKSSVLLEEAEKDLTSGCYNKTISASWFAVEVFLRGLLLALGMPVPARPNKLISVIHKLIGERLPQYLWVCRLLSKLYDRRRRADHREVLFDETVAENTLREAKRVLAALREIAKTLVRS